MEAYKLSFELYMLTSDFLQSTEASNLFQYFSHALSDELSFFKQSYLFF